MLFLSIRYLRYQYAPCFTHMPHIADCSSVIQCVAAALHVWWLCVPGRCTAIPYALSQLCAATGVQCSDYQRTRTQSHPCQTVRQSCACTDREYSVSLSAVDEGLQHLLDLGAMQHADSSRPAVRKGVHPAKPKITGWLPHRSMSLLS